MFELDRRFLMFSGPLERAKQDTIKVTKGTNAKLPHHRGLV